MKRFFYTIIMFSIAVIAWGQAGVALNQQNMKFEKGMKPDPIKVKPPIDNTIPIDTSTVYFALVDSAQQAIKAENWLQAENYLLEAIKSEPGNPSNSLLLSNIATIQRRQGRLNEAVRNYSMAIDLTPNAVTLLHNRAAVYILLDSIALAQADYERIMLIDESDVESR